MFSLPKLVIESPGQQIHVSLDVAVVRIAVKSFNRDVRGSSLKRSDAAIGHAAVVKVFVTDCDSGLFAWLNRERRIDAITFEIHKVAKTA